MYLLPPLLVMIVSRQNIVRIQVLDHAPLRPVRSPDEEPIIDVSQRIRHEWLRLIMPPLAIHYELVLVVPAVKG